MQPLTYFLPQARDHVRSLWSLDGTRMASQAIKWLYSEEGAAAYIFWVSQMLDSMTAKEEWRSDLATQIFRLQAEIAARREGWCPELESPGRDTYERNYSRVVHDEEC